MSRYNTGDPFNRCPTCGGIEGVHVRPLTAKQAAIYGYLLDYTAQHGFAPSFEDIAGQFQYNSLATVHEHLHRLEAKGWIKRAYKLARAVECLVPRSEIAA